MTAYYNEIDPYAAAWLRNLVAAGRIAPGDVDERSIRDVKPDDIKAYTQCHFFAGIGVWSAALRLAGWADDRPVWTGSCPCQPFSAAGKGGGFDDERHLWPDLFRLIAECKPGVVFGEQVASKDGLAWLDLVQADLEGADYASGAVDLCAAGVGAPHIRQRLYWVADANHAERGPDATRGDERHGSDTGRPQGSGDPERCVEPGRLDHGDDTRLEGHGRGYQTSKGWVGSDGSAAETGEPSGMGNTPDEPRERGAGGVLGAEAQEHGARVAVDGYLSVGLEHASEGMGGSAAGPTNGVWRDADWLFCRDGKWRPVSAGTFPLVDGSTGGMVRVCATCLQKGNLNEKLRRLLNLSGGDEGRRKEKVLQPSMHGSWPHEGSKDSGRWEISSAEYVRSKVLSEVRESGTEATSSPQKREPDGQLIGEHRDPLRPLSLNSSQEASASVKVRGLRGFIHGGITPKPEQGLQECNMCGGVGENLFSAALGSNRAAKLKAYGNAIVAPLAAEVIGAWMDIHV